MTISIRSLVRAAVASLLLVGLVPGASAGEKGDLADWKERASFQISNQMRYPRLLPHRTLPPSHNVVTARIDRSGKVLEIALDEPSGIRKFDQASEDFARRLRSLPPLPDGFAADGAKVRMHLIYAQNQRQVAREMGTIVRMQELASSRADTELAGQPVIDLFGIGE